ncbi:TPA: restriction endonuclease subunit S [Pseudomonas sp. H2]|uniref:restriction endonuclease subunit S n=1 Tax=Pseudomonas sp. H2 TaxID=658612 RepID=UPI000AE38B08|nr:restriction endonuclease subunit S [Pseudomonas sp. H2]
MTALLTDNLPLLAGAPNGIQKLRELILELAVRGKLVSHDASDEPASELLKRIAAEKTQLVAEGKLKKQKALADVSDSEKPFVLPVGWAWAFWDTIALKIGDIDHKMPDTTSEGVPFVSPRDFYPGNVINFDGAKRISVEDFERLSEKIKAERGDLIYPRYGTIGENILVDVERDFLVSYSCAVIKVAHGFIDPIYQFYVSMSGCIRKQAKAAENKTTQANVGIKSIQQYLFPIPPLAEQQRIVAKVDYLMALCNRLEAQQTDAENAHARLVQALLDSLTQTTGAADFAENWKRLSEYFHILFTTEQSIDALKQTMLQLAVMGKLVPQEPSDEPASKLLKRISGEKARLIAEGTIKKQRQPAQITETEKSFELPENWEWVRLEEIAQVGTGATPLRTNPKYFSPATINWVTSGETSQDYIHESEQKVAPLALTETNLTVYPPHTLIIAMYGQGKTRGQISELLIDACTNQACAAIQLLDQDESHRRFVKYFFVKSYDDIRLLAAGGAQPNLNLGKIKETVLPLPPVIEQHRIVAKLDQLMTLCDQLKARLTQARQLNEQLASTFVERAVTEDSQHAPMATDRKIARTLLAAEITHRLHN